MLTNYNVFILFFRSGAFYFHSFVRSYSWAMTLTRLLRVQPAVVNYEEILTQLQHELREWEERKAAAISAHRTAVTRLLLWGCVLEVFSILWYASSPDRPARSAPRLTVSALSFLRYYFWTSPMHVLDHLIYIAPALFIPIM